MKNGDFLKKSDYNFIIPIEDGTYTLFNSVTGVIVSVYEDKELQKLKEIMNSDTIVYQEDGFINELFNKGFLVESHKNEYEYIRYLYEKEIIKDNELSIILILTRQCNLRCIYCYEKHENLFMKEEVYHSLELFLEDSLKEGKYSVVNITLFGGEPLLEYNKIVKFLHNVKDICERNNVGFGVGSSTNGALLTPERFEVLSSLNSHYYQITIDGFEDTHDKYRASADKKGTFNKIIENLKYMNSTNYDFQVTIRTNFNDEVFEKAKDFYQFIKENFDQRFTVYYEGIKRLGGENDKKLDILESQEVSKSSINIAKHIYDLGIRNDIITNMTLPFNRVCYATKHNNFIIDYDGSIMKCTVALDDELNKIGRLTKEGIMDIDEVKHSCWVGKKIELDDKCKDCRILPICYGGRCVNDRVHGGKFYCNKEEQEKELEELIPYYV